MYLASVVLLLVIVPAVAIAVELAVPGGSASVVFLLGKWVVFSAVGLRLVLAGIRQLFNPRFTAETIFETTDAATLKVVAELGIGNLAIGVLGLLTVYWNQWIVPAAIVGCAFYLLAGVKHAVNGGRNRHQDIAMFSDIAVGVVLALYLVAVWAGAATP